MSPARLVPSAVVSLEASLLEGIHSVAHVYMHEKCQKYCCVKFKPCLPSHFHTPGQSLSEVSVNVKLSVSENYRNCRTQPPQFRHWESVGGGSIRRFSTIWQVLLFKYNGIFTPLFLKLWSGAATVISSSRWFIASKYLTDRVIQKMNDWNRIRNCHSKNKSLGIWCWCV